MRGKNALCLTELKYIIDSRGFECVKVLQTTYRLISACPLWFSHHSAQLVLIEWYSAYGLPMLRLFILMMFAPLIFASEFGFGYYPLRYSTWLISQLKLACPIVWGLR